MKLKIYLIILISIICIFFDLATFAIAADISGRWVADVDDSSITMTFIVNGTVLTGKVDNSTIGSSEIKEGAIDGSKVSFHVLSKLPGFGDSEFKISWSGEVIGDEIIFKREFAGTSKGVIARRGTGKSENISKQEKAQNNAGPYDHLSGTWTGRVPLGEMDLDLQVNGSSVSGTASLSGRAVGEIKDGKIEDNKITFHAVRQEGFNTTEIPFEGIVKGDKIHFSFISVNNGRPVKFVATKMESDLEEEQAAQESEGPYKHIAGKWTASYINGLMSINFKVKGNELTGTVSPAEFTVNDILDGKIENNEISFYALNKNLNMQKADWEGTIVGDKIHFTVRFPTNTLKFIARKVNAVKKEKAKDEIQLPPTVNPSGTWIMEANGQQITLSLKSFGMSLTGMVRIPPQNANIMIPPDARISGDTISFSITKRIGPNLFRIPWTGKVRGNEIHFEGGPFNQFEDVIAKRIKDSGGDDTGTLSIKLVRSEEIKNSKINDEYKKLRNEDKEYDSAMSYFDEYRYSFSLPLMEQLIKRLPDDPVILHRLGVCLIMQSIYPTETREQKDMRVRARGLLEKAKTLGMENDMLEYYLKVIPADGGDNNVFSKQKKVEELITDAERYFALRDFQKSIGLYASAMEMDPTNYRAVLYIGDSYFANGQNREAMEWFELATKVDPDKETAWRYWGDCLMRMGKKEEGQSYNLLSR